MSDPPPLKDFQNLLLELLASGMPAEDVIATLKSDSRYACYHQYASEFDPDMVAVASELMGTWAVRYPLNTDEK